MSGKEPFVPRPRRMKGPGKSGMTSVRLDPALWERVRAHAERHNFTLTSCMEAALDQWLRGQAFESTPPVTP